MRISLAGDLGSGKSSVAKALCNELNIACLSTGQLHRNIAEEYGVDSLELNQIANGDKSIDDRIDTYLMSLNQTDEDLVIDSRLAWHFVRDTFKVYLEVNSSIGAERVLRDSVRTREPAYDDRGAALASLRFRKKAENVRFFDRYGVRCDDLSNYDVIINTTDSSVEETSSLILKLYKEWDHQARFPKFWVSPRFVFPTEHVRSLSREKAQLLRAEINKFGFLPQYPIECAKVNDFYFIWNGHRRVSGAIFENIEFIPFCLIAKEEEEIQKGHTAEEFVRNSFRLSWCYDWEDVHGFRFVKYPEIPQTDKSIDLHSSYA
jgi:CMP/dCMP kinase